LTADLTPASGLIEVRDADVGDTIEVYEPVYDAEGNEAAYRPTGRTYRVARGSPLTGPRACWDYRNGGRVKVRVAESACAGGGRTDPTPAGYAYPGPAPEGRRWAASPGASSGRACWGAARGGWPSYGRSGPPALQVRKPP
jgi:hypothetical protein